MKQIRFLMIGGFLGAGKTTTIAKLAQHYTATGLKVGIVTNDQAYDLVDTHTLRSKGFAVGEVPGACFCCKFDDLIETVGDLSQRELPDIVIAEPVGSCTDLYSTVIEPMRVMFGDRFELGPLIVLLKPEHGRKILGRDSSGGKKRGFSPQAEYIFLKQLEEADAIAINKADKLSEDQTSELLSAVAEQFSGVPAFAISAREGDGFEQLVDAASMDVDRKKMMEVDYDVYAQGEAELGWLNCQVQAAADEPFWLDELVVRLTSSMGNQLVASDLEVAHLKILGQTIENAAVANLVHSEGAAELSLASEIKTKTADLLVNARVAADPESLVAMVKHAALKIQSELGVTLTISQVQSFRPAKPEPTHRLNTE